MMHTPNSFAQLATLANHQRPSAPLCEEVNVALVTYVFGHGLPKNGKCVTDRNDIVKLQRTGHEYTAYVVEACPQCRWHHLLRVLPIAVPKRPRTAAKG